MLFQVFNQSGRVVMYTEYKSCIPDLASLKYMASCGYKFKIDGRSVSADKVSAVEDKPAVKTKARKLF